MKLTPEHFATLLEAAKPLIEWLNENCHPHCEARVDQSSVTLTEDIARNGTTEFLKD